MTLAIISAYLVGCVLSYLFYRWIYSDEWTVSKRTLYIIVSLFSWLFIILNIFIAFYRVILNGLNNQNKAKW